MNNFASKLNSWNSESQKLVGLLGLAHTTLEIEESAIRHQTHLTVSQNVSLPVEWFALFRVFLNYALPHFLMEVYQFFRPVYPVVFLNLVVVNLDLLTNDGTSFCHKMSGNWRIQFWSGAFFHFFASFTRIKYFWKLIFLCFVSLLFCLLPLKDLLLK